MRCGNRAAESGFGPARKEKCKEMKRRAQYARWPLAANAVNKNNNYQITSDTSEKDRNI
jgi:hypothetical protein